MPNKTEDREVEVKDGVVRELRVWRPLDWKTFPPTIGDIADFVIQDRKRFGTAKVLSEKKWKKIITQFYIDWPAPGQDVYARPLARIIHAAQTGETE